MRFFINKLCLLYLLAAGSGVVAIVVVVVDAGIVVVAGAARIKDKKNSVTEKFYSVRRLLFSDMSTTC